MTALSRITCYAAHELSAEAREALAQDLYAVHAEIFDDGRLCITPQCRPRQIARFIMQHNRRNSSVTGCKSLMLGVHVDRWRGRHARR